MTERPGATTTTRIPPAIAEAVASYRRGNTTAPAIAADLAISVSASSCRLTRARALRLVPGPPRRVDQWRLAAYRPDPMPLELAKLAREIAEARLEIAELTQRMDPAQAFHLDSRHREAIRRRRFHLAMKHQEDSSS